MECVSLSGGDQGERVAQVGQVGVEEVIAGVCKLAPVGDLPSARGGRGQCMRREAAMAALSFARPSAIAICFCGSLGFLHEHSQLQSSSLPSPQAISSQPTAVPSLGLLSKPHIPAPSSRAHWWTPVSGWGVHGYGTKHLCRSHSVLPATDRLLGSPPSP